MAATEKNGTMAMGLVLPFIALAEQHGYPEAQAFVRSYFGLTKPEAEDLETRLPVHRVVDLFNAFIDATGNRDLGLIGARLIDAEHMGIGEFLAKSRGTIRDAFESGARYTRLLGDGAQHGLNVEGDVVRWRVEIDPALRVHEAAYEFIVAIGVLRTRTMTGLRDLAPLEVHFMHSEPANTTRHKKLFACPVLFDMPITQVIMSTKFLNRKLATAEPGLGKLLERQAHGMLQRLPPPGDAAAQVRAMLQAELRLRDVSSEQIARQMGIGVRGLSRRLEKHNTSFRELLDDARKRVALRELSLAARPISEIAYILGFSSTQSFHRAFRRWTGTSAARWRDATSE